MIWVDRKRKENGKVIKPNKKWFNDAKHKTQKAIDDGPGHNVSNFYKHQEVKKALEKLFYDKCAYCESNITAAGPWDVEHYRPKGRVAERPDDHPGYYWLAYTWKNLYPSCQFCNQSRKDQPRYDDPTMGEAQGKLDQFPIENEDNRAMTPYHDISLEKPLLLDPNNKNDDPEKHFTYDIKGNILPLDKNDRFATETIRICHLDRRRLIDARLTKIIQARELMKMIKIAESKNNNLAVELLQEAIEGMKAPKQVYIGAVRAVERDRDAFITNP
jgi:uncharacterized protein (TIGR02646 family)